jgi:membrane protein YqaA with SNARE-associated domain
MVSILKNIEKHKEFTIPIALIVLFTIFVATTGMQYVTELFDITHIVQDTEILVEDAVNTFGALAILLYGFVPSLVRIIGTTGFFIALFQDGVNPFILIGLGALGETLGSSVMYIIGRYIFRLLKGKHKELAPAEHFLVKYRLIVFYLIPFAGSLGDVAMILAGHERIGLMRILPFVLLGNFVRYGIWFMVTIGQLNL